MPFLSRWVKCPSCGRRIGGMMFKRIEPCSVTGDLICSECSIDGRFSPKIADRVPPEFRQKFRFYNWFLYGILTIVAFVLIQHAWWAAWDGWYFADLMVTLEKLGMVLLFIIGGLFVFFLTSRLPHLGDWMFYWWISKPKNKEKVLAAMEAYGRKEYVSKDKIYMLKRRIALYFENTNYKLLFIVALVLNIVFMVLYYVVRGDPALDGTLLSVFAGYIFLGSFGINLITIVVCSAYYCNKTDMNKKQKTLLELFQYLYIILLPLALFGVVLTTIAAWNVIDELSVDMASTFALMSQVGLIGQAVVICLFDIVLILKAKPNYDLNLNRGQNEFDIVRKQPLYVIKFIPKSIVTILFVALLLVLLLLSFLIMIADVAMAICVLSSTYLLFGLAFPVMFVVLKLIPRTPHRYNQSYWVVVKMCLIIIGVMSTPAVFTQLYTNVSVENQFDTMFGSNWESLITPTERAKMRDYQFSWFDAFFGFDVEINAKYNINYTYDSPRYVCKAGDESVILSNGSSKFTDMLDSFVFDAYLPQDLGFGDMDMTKLPVIIFSHGIGQVNGVENVNWTSQYLANEGYLVCDMTYGKTDMRTNNSYPSDPRDFRKGYDFPDTVRHLGNFTKFLYTNRDYYHADLSRVYFAGRSFGGWMAAVCALGYNVTYMAGNFSEHMTVRGCIPYYGAHEILNTGSDLMTNPLIGEFISLDAPYVRGSSNPSDPDYNPEWIYYNPFQLAKEDVRGFSNVCPTLLFHGTNDFMVPPGWSRRLQQALIADGQIAIGAYHPLGSHGYDALHWSQYGQSIIYWFERFLALTN